MRGHRIERAYRAFRVTLRCECGWRHSLARTPGLEAKVAGAERLHKAKVQAARDKLEQDHG